MNGDELKINKKLIFPVIAIAILTVALISENQASANANSPKHESLIQKIAEKFDLSEGEVEKVFEEVRMEHKAEKHTMLEEKLTQDVKNEKITEEQKELILQKHEELGTQKETLKDSWQEMSREERQAQKIQNRSDLQNWADEVGVDPEYIFPGFGSKIHKGFGHKN